MRVGVDARCLQDSVLTGVGEYTWQVLRALGGLPGAPELTALVSGAKPVHVPPGMASRLRLVRSQLPNKVRNLAFFFGLGRTLDQLLAEAPGACEVLWLPNPSFTHVSGQVPVVLTVHDLSFMHYPEFFPRRGRLWYFPAVTKLLRTLPARSLVAAVSHHTAADVAEQFPNLARRLRVVPPGVGEEFFTDIVPGERERVSARYQLPPQFLLSLGTLEPRKNYQLLWRAYDELVRRQPDWPYDLVVAGGWGWRYGPLKRLYQHLPSRRRIHLVGYVAPADKPALYRAATLFLYPSLYEGFGIPALEAMAAGVPVLVSHSSSLPEVVGEAGVLLDPWQPDAWVEAISWLMGDSDARRAYVARGRARAQQFTWPAAAGAYQALFQELTG